MDSAVSAIKEEITQLRHHFHANPETGFVEFKTQEKLIETLISFGCVDIKKCAGTGLVVDIKGKGPASSEARCVALRSDIDALKMVEENADLPYRSKNTGAAHMCGHDGHMAMLLGATKVICQSVEKIPNNCTVRLLFQPAEEGPGGAEVMIKEGCLDGVDEVYGIHNWPTKPIGKMMVIPGPFMAHVSTFEIVVRGKGGHGSQPQESIDPILVGSHIVTSIHSIISRNVHYKESAVISVCYFQAGTTHNVTPDTAHIKGTIRDLNPEVFELIKKRLNAVVTKTAESFGATADLEITSLYPVLVNSEKETENVIRVAKKVLGEDCLMTDDLPVLGAEDFAYFTQKVPGCFYFLGGTEEGRSNAMCHCTNFDFNDNMIPIGVKMWLSLLEDRFSMAFF